MEGREDLINVMIKDNQKIFNRLFILLDALMITAAYLITYPIRFIWIPRYDFVASLDGVGRLGFYEYAYYLILVVPGYLICYGLSNLYKQNRGKGKTLELWGLIRANFLGGLYFTFVLYLIKQTNLSRMFFFLFAALNFTFAVGSRYILYRIMRSIRKKGLNQKHLLIVGYSRAAEAYLDRLAANPDWGYQVHGILDDNMENGTVYKKVKVIGKIEELEERLSKNDMDEIVIALSLQEYSKLERIVFLCEKTGVHTKFVPDYNNMIATNPYTEDLYGLPVINIRNVPLSNTFYKILKRAMDLFLGSIALLIFAIPMLLVAILVKLTSPGPIIYSQIRIGLHNKEFKMYKFRSMRVQDPKHEAKGWTTAGDDRVTNLGKFIRKTSLDEFPQLFNVLRGDMSLIGPRPERPQFVEKFKEEVPRYMIKHQVRPGMSGWAQINGYRGDTSIKKRIEYDLYYIENWTIRLDIKIMFFTIFRGFVNKNAY